MKSDYRVRTVSAAELSKWQEAIELDLDSGHLESVDFGSLLEAFGEKELARGNRGDFVPLDGVWSENGMVHIRTDGEGEWVLRPTDEVEVAWIEL